MFWAFSWVLIPLAGILYAGFSEWLKFKEKTQQLGSSTKELEGTVARLRETVGRSEAQQKALVQRVQNLEAIVTTQAWDALHDDAPPPPKRERLPPTSPHVLFDDSDDEPSDAEKTARLARRLRT